MTEPVDSTAVEVGHELEPAGQHPPTTLFRTDDPAVVVERATAAANVLKRVIVDKGLASQISGREHVRVEGWQTLGSMLGVVPVVVWTRELENGWEARVEARTLDGRVVGAAEAMCTKDERTWKTRDPYALRSMAQTRATSKALRGPLGFVVTLAGYDATPAEEIPDASPSQARQQQQQDDGNASPSQIRMIYEAASGKLTALELFTLALNARGATVQPGTDEATARRLLDAAVKKIPADKVADVMVGINDAGEKELG